MNAGTGWESVGPALGAGFLHHDIGPVLRRLGIVPPDGPTLAAAWSALATRLRRLGDTGGPRHVLNQVIAPLATALGYADPVRQDPVATREGTEDGGFLLPCHTGTGLRAWAVGTDTPLDAPRASRSGRHDPARAAHRVLRASRETAGLLTDGAELRLLLSDPALPDSHLAIPLGGADGWRARPDPPDSLALLLCLAGATTLPRLPDLLSAARLHQARVTTGLRAQARAALEAFLQAVLDHPDNRLPRSPETAAALWHDGLILVYRLLFILKLESAADPARAFSFAATRLWRESLSPNLALGPLVRRNLDLGHDTGALLEDGVRLLFRCCRDGLTAGEIAIAPLGGALFGPDTMPALEALRWGDRATAHLLDRLLWTTPRSRPRERVHYGALDVEDLGSVYESLLDLEPAIGAPPMVRTRRVRPEAAPPGLAEPGAIIPPGRFHLRPGAARKATGAYYTPHAFVSFLVRETLAPRLAAISPEHDPDPVAILALRVVDPACGSGHFLVEACRHLGQALLAACRSCDADPARFGHRLDALPDPDGQLRAYLPSRSGGAVAEQRALALCRRLAAVHCLYGVDTNPLAVELAKLSLWLESHAEGLPLTFLDHRLLAGDSLAAPFFADLACLPVGGQPLDPLLAHGIADRLAAMHATALEQVRALQATIGRDLADLTLKQAAKRRLDAARAPLLGLARAWSGAVMLGTRDADDEYLALARHIADTGTFPAAPSARQQAIAAAGAAALPWDLTFPEVFAAGGFDVILGNPPWDVVQHNTRDFIARHDPAVLDAPDRGAQAAIERRVLSDPAIAATFDAYRAGFQRQKRLASRLFRHQRVGDGRGSTAGNLDLFRLFAERAIRLAAPDGAVGLLLPSAFHANEGSTGIRRLFLENGLETCFSFENRAGIFDIDSRFRFALVVARRPGPATALRCAFYLDAIGQTEDPGRLMTYDRAFIDRVDPVHHTLLELRGPAEARVARVLFTQALTFGRWCAEAGIRLGRDLHMTGDAHRFTPADGRMGSGGWLPLHEGKTFHQYTDRWDTPVRTMVHIDALADKRLVRAAAAHPRLAFRDIARSTDQRCAIAAILPAGVVAGHTVTIEKTPHSRRPEAALALCALMNSFVFDWLVRLKTATHLSLYLLDGLPVPRFDAATAASLADAAARLSASPGPDPAERRALRARIDAVVAHAYGLGQAGYARILAGFNHKAWPDAPTLCLAAHARLRPPGSGLPRSANRSIAHPCQTKPTHGSPPSTRPIPIPAATRATRPGG